MNYDCPDLKAAENKALNAKTVVDNLSDLIKSGGGKKGIHRHTVINKKLLVRHRLKLLFDDDSPVLEIGLFAGMCMDYGTIPAASSVAGKYLGFSYWVVILLFFWISLSFFVVCILLEIQWK